MEESQKDLKAENSILKEKLQRLTRINKCYLEALYFYGAIKAVWDNGRKARTAVNNTSNEKYKPVDSAIAQIFVDKEIKWLGPNEEMIGYEDYINGNINNNDTK